MHNGFARKEHPMTQLVTLNPKMEFALGYRHENTIARFKKDHPQWADQAEAVWKETMKFLYLASTKVNLGASGSNTMAHQASVPSKKVDEMWHGFVLHTKDYFPFCDALAGAYIHHAPFVEGEDHSSAPIDFERTVNDLKEMFGEVDTSIWRIAKNPCKDVMGDCQPASHDGSGIKNADCSVVCEGELKAKVSNVTMTEEVSSMSGCEGGDCNVMRHGDDGMFKREMKRLSRWMTA